MAGGGDLSVARLRAAYQQGIFPWYNEPPLLWWSPDPRAILEPQHLHISRSLKRTLKKCGWTVQVTAEMREVLSACAEREEGTWLNEEMQCAYQELAESGYALAYEVRQEGELIGGLYGVLTSGLFAAESKFHRVTDASKVALVAAVTHLFQSGLRLFDVQFLTPHLSSLGVIEISREEYLKRLQALTGLPEDPCPSSRVLAHPHSAQLLPWLLEQEL